MYHLLTPTIMTKLRTKMIQLMEREQYAKSTIQNYVRVVAQFAQFHGKCPSTLGEEHVARYLDHLCRQGVSISLLNITHSGLRWFYTRVLDRGWNNGLFRRPRRNRTAEAEAVTGSIKYRRSKGDHQAY